VLSFSPSQLRVVPEAIFSSYWQFYQVQQTFSRVVYRISILLLEIDVSWKNSSLDSISATNIHSVKHQKKLTAERFDSCILQKILILCKYHGASSSLSMNFYSTKKEMEAIAQI